MIRLIANIILSLLATAVGLWLASILLDGFDIDLQGFVTTIIFFTVASFILEPLMISLTFRYLPVFRGGIALVTTFVVLILTDAFTTGLTINGFTTLFISAFIVWFSIVLASLVLPLFLFKKWLSNKDQTPSTPTPPVA